MSWNNTVTCSHCYTKGHNKRGCVELLREMRERLESDPTDYRAKTFFDKRTVQSARRSAKKRKCSYCDEAAGHTRRTCSTMKEHMAITIAAQKAYRKGVLARLKEQGLGVGAVVTLQGAMTTDDGQTAMPLVVTRINWNDINTWRTEADILVTKPITMVFSSAYGSTRTAYLPLDLAYHNEDTVESYDNASEDSWQANNRHYYYPTLVTPIPSEFVNAPPSWVSGQDGVKEAYKARKSWQGAIGE